MLSCVSVSVSVKESNGNPKLAHATSQAGTSERRVSQGYSPRAPILRGCTYEAYVNLLWTPHNLASLGALRAQIPTGLVQHESDFALNLLRHAIESYRKRVQI